MFGIRKCLELGYNPNDCPCTKTGQNENNMGVFMQGLQKKASLNSREIFGIFRLPDVSYPG
jgi:hypothetical protein